MYCSGQVPFLPSLSPKILVGESRYLGKHPFPFFAPSGRVLLKSFAPQISPGLTPLLKLAFCKLWLIPLTCPSQILLPDTACISFALGVPSLPRRVFLIIISRLMELGDLARPCTHTLRGLLPINCCQPGPCTTEPRL